MTIRDRGPLYPVIGILLAGAAIVLIRMFAGIWPNAVFIGSVAVIGIGAGLVIARIGRLGPFEGRLGSPWYEASLQSTLIRETARAVRFSRELTVIVVRQDSGSKIDWRTEVRLSDQVLRCRNGWNILILPETPEEGAIGLIRRIELMYNAGLQTSVIGPGLSSSHVETCCNDMINRLRSSLELPKQSAKQDENSEMLTAQQ